jgi:HlyD family secretion protein
MSRPLLVLAGALTLTAAAAGCAPHPSSAAAPVALPVSIATAREPGARAIYRGPGTVAAPHTYAVGFEIAGRIASVRADIGDRIAAGTVLASLDAADYAAQYRSADAHARSAAAAARKAVNGARAQERTQAADAVRSAAAQVDRALAAERLASANLDRYSALVRDGDVSQQQFDSAAAAARDASAQVSAARAQLAQAQAQYSLVMSGTRREDLAAADAEAAAARASADLAAITLRKTSIVAPADVDVVARTIEPGDEAQPGVPAFTLIDAGKREVRIAVPEAKLDGIAIGTRAEITIDGVRRRGTVSRIEPAADAATRTAQVRIAVTDLNARPGTVVDVALGERRSLGTASIPLAAVITAEDGTQSVAVYDGERKTTQRRRVRVVGTDGDRALVAGIVPGTAVVAAGAHLVTPGAAVRVVSAR